MMVVAYLAHPIGGQVLQNLEKVKSIARQINLQEPDTVPFVPYFIDCHCLDDGVIVERLRGIKNNVELMQRGFIDELRLYGDKISSGMQAEIQLAHKLGIKIVPMTYATKSQFESLDL